MIKRFAPVLLVLFVVGCANVQVSTPRVWLQGVQAYNSLVTQFALMTNAGMITLDKAEKFDKYRAVASDALDKLKENLDKDQPSTTVALHEALDQMIITLTEKGNGI